MIYFARQLYIVLSGRFQYEQPMDMSESKGVRIGGGTLWQQCGTERNGRMVIDNSHDDYAEERLEITGLGWVLKKLRQRARRRAVTAPTIPVDAGRERKV